MIMTDQPAHPHSQVCVTTQGTYIVITNRKDSGPLVPIHSLIRVFTVCNAMMPRILQAHLTYLFQFPYEAINP